MLPRMKSSYAEFFKPSSSGENVEILPAQSMLVIGERLDQLVAERSFLRPDDLLHRVLDFADEGDLPGIGRR